MTKVTPQNSGRKKVFSVSALGHLDINVRGKEEKLDPYLTPSTNSNSKGKSKRTNLMFMARKAQYCQEVGFSQCDM